MPNQRTLIPVCLTLLVLAGPGTILAAGAGDTTATPRPLVAAYDSLADTILGAKKTEWNLVHSILASTFSHAEATLAQARAKMQAGENAGAEIEKLAELVAQLGNEGDASVAAVRKRLLDGGHHHNAAGEQQGIYDEGFVIVTKAAKQTLLAAAKEIARTSGKGSVSELEAQWRKVEEEFGKLHRNVPM